MHCHNTANFKSHSRLVHIHRKGTELLKLGSTTGAEDSLCQCLEAAVNQPGTWGHQLIQVVCAAPCTHPSLINAQGRPSVVEEGGIKMVVKAFVDHEYDRASTTAYSLWETAWQVHVEGSLVRACPDGARQGFKHFKFKQWREGTSPDQNIKYNHRHAYAAFAHSTHHVRVLSIFSVTICGLSARLVGNLMRVGVKESAVSVIIEQGNLKMRLIFFFAQLLNRFIMSIHECYNH
jgi:glutaredoxin-related protein